MATYMYLLTCSIMTKCKYFPVFFHYVHVYQFVFFLLISELQLKWDYHPYELYKQWKDLLVCYTNCDYDAKENGVYMIIIS